MNLEIINKLYLELSQITTAKTGSENYLEILLEKRDKDHAKTIAQLQADNAKLRNALQLLQDNQNGCPLPKYEIDWNEAMRLSYELLGETK